MRSSLERKPEYVLGPLGAPLSVADLPATNNSRWVVMRKAAVVAAVNGGLLSLEEACSRYNLTVEEFMSWKEAIGRSGLLGLRVSKLSNHQNAML